MYNLHDLKNRTSDLLNTAVISPPFIVTEPDSPASNFYSETNIDTENSKSPAGGARITGIGIGHFESAYKFAEDYSTSLLFHF